MVDENINSTPLVSIITATLNAGKYLSQALDSIVHQSYQNFELLIVDGGSTDNTLEIVRSYPRATLTKQVGTGLFDAWNQGLRMAGGEYFAILDSDDIWEPTALANHLELLMQDPTKLGSVGHVNFFLEKDQPPPPEFKLSLLEKSHRAYMPGCFVGRKEIINKIGYYETEWKIASDIIWFGKVKELQNEICLLDRVVLNKRVHRDNISYNSVDEDIYGKELLKLLHLKIKSRQQ